MPDLFAVNRLSDYLERHGKTLESAVVTRTFKERVTFKRKRKALELLNRVGNKVDSVSRHRTSNYSNILNDARQDKKKKSQGEEEDNNNEENDDNDEDDDNDDEEEEDEEDEDEDEAENNINENNKESNKEEYYTKDVRLYVVRVLLPLPAHTHVAGDSLMSNMTAQMTYSANKSEKSSANNTQSNNNNNNNIYNSKSNNYNNNEDDADNNDNDNFTHLPGTCVAQGEAYNSFHALSLCAMHAELLIDALGLPLYDHPVLQRKHSDTARTLGRWAPLSIHGNRPPSILGPIHIPAPLRKPLARSTMWLEYLAEREGQERAKTTESKKTVVVPITKQNESQSLTNANEEVSAKAECNDVTKTKEHNEDAAITATSSVEWDNTTTTATTTNSKNKEYNILKRENSEKCKTADYVKEVEQADKDEEEFENSNYEDVNNNDNDEDEDDAVNDKGCISINTNNSISKTKYDTNVKDEHAKSKSNTLTDDELCDISKLRPVHPSDVFIAAAKHISYFFRCRGVDFSRVIRQYTVDCPPYGRVNRSIVTLPLPDKFGIRNAVAIASNKRRAYVLCAMHATQILDALNIAIYSGRKQDLYARLGELKGRPAPRQNEAIRPPSTPSPPGLVCLENVVLTGKPPIPLQPNVTKIMACHREWDCYVKACVGYMKQIDDTNVAHSVLTLHRAPRRGVEVEDRALAEVENREEDRFTLNRLKTLTIRTRLPEPGEFDVNGFNAGSERFYLAVVHVDGTPFEARG